jgi:hypothetical protein
LTSIGRPFTPIDRPVDLDRPSIDSIGRPLTSIGRTLTSSLSAILSISHLFSPGRWANLDASLRVR